MKDNVFKIGKDHYTFAQGAEELNIFNEETQAVQKTKTSDLVEKYTKGDKPTVKQFQDWASECSSVLVKVDEATSKNIGLFEELTSKIDALEAENAALKGKTPAKTKDLEDKITALEAENASLRIKLENSTPKKFDESKTGGEK